MTPTPAELTRPPRPQDPPSGEGRHPQRPSSPFADPFGSCPSRPETSFTGERFRGGQSTVRDPLRRAANRGWARKTTADAGWDGLIRRWKPDNVVTSRLTVSLPPLLRGEDVPLPRMGAGLMKSR